jgi:NitT/TauT family transport system ATP-binding protein
MLDVINFKRPETKQNSTGDGRIEFKDVSVTFGKSGAEHKAVDNTTITIEPGEFVCIL